jgi:peptide/nickel transport system substrate-binding protein
VIQRAIGIGLVALVACSPTAARRGNTVVLASGADLQSVNSLVTTHPLAKQVQRYVLLTTLVRYDSALAVVPYLAQRWRWSADSLRLTMILHAGVRWHDGRPTTARDAAWTLEAARDPAVGYPRRSDLADLASATAVDDSTLELIFSRRPGRIPDVLTDLAILPAHLLASTPPAQMRSAAWNDRPVGNGPFRFVRHDPNRRWIFAADPGFPPSLGGRPKLDQLAIAVVDEPTTKLAALATGELDFAGIQPAHASFVEKDSTLRVLDYPLLFSYLMVFNARRPPFDDPRARRAIDLAIDRLAIVTGFLYGFGVPAATPLPPELDRGPAPPLRFAPGRGRALIDSRPLTFELLTVGSGEAAMEQMIQQQLSRIGVTVTIRQLELATFLDRVRVSRDFDAAIMGVSGDLELGYLRSLFEFAGIALPAGRRGAALLPLFADSMPVSFLYHARGVQGMQRRMKGVRMDLRGELASVTSWSVE